MANGVNRSHVFYAEASAFDAYVDQPPAAVAVPEQVLAKLSPYGGSANHSQLCSFPGIVSIASAATHVSGAQTGATWTTVATSVVQGLSICGGVVSADEVTAKITSVYPAVGYVPAISFQGTQFTNLKINGQLIHPNFNLNIMSPQPANDVPYVSDLGFQNRIQQEYNAIANAAAAPQWLKTAFQWNAASIPHAARLNGSLVTAVAGVAGTFGHVIVVPNFGNVYLCELGVSNHFEVTMIRVEITIKGKTQVRVSMFDSQGHTMP